MKSFSAALFLVLENYTAHHSACQAAIPEKLRKNGYFFLF